MNNTIPIDFNWKVYISLNSDIKHIKDKKNAYKHYLNHGQKENRPYKYNLPRDFNWKVYISLNCDLNHIKDKKNAYEHYLNHGQKENRPYKYKLPFFFNWEKYISLNSDLKHINNKKSACAHYLNYGILEKRNYMPKSFVYNNLYELPNSNNITNSDKLFTIHNKQIYSSLDESSIIFTKLFFKEFKYNKCYLDNNILDDITNFILIIDFNNGGGGTTFFLNSIISKYKYYQTFVIVRNINNELTININEEYFLNKKYNLDESLFFIDNYQKKITKVFINHIMNHNILFINKLFTINKQIIGISHDYFNLFNNPQPYYHEIHELLKTQNPLIDISKYDTLITQHVINTNIFSKKYSNNIDVVSLPDYKNTYKKINDIAKSFIVVGIIGNIINIKGKNILENILNYYTNDSSIKIVVFGHVISDICINKHSYDNISELNNLLSIHKPNVLLELSLWPETYSYTLTLSMITDLPILFFNKNFNSVIKNRLINYTKAHKFSSMIELDELIRSKKQNYFYTIEPKIYFNEYWDDLFVNKKKMVIEKIKTPIHNIQPYFIYFPQFHKIEENDILFYENFNDIKNLELYNKSCNTKLDIPLLSYLEISNIGDYNLTNTAIIQKQINLIDYYQFKGFALYYYWFSINTITQKNMIMKKVIDIFFSDCVHLKEKKIFFIWANEDWTNNDAFGNTGNNIENVYDESSFIKNGVNLLKYFKHVNYLKINNKPVFFVYHNYLLTNLTIFYRVFNNLCICNGFDGIHLVLNSFDVSFTEKMQDIENINHSKFYINFNYKQHAARYIDKDSQLKLNYEKYIDNSYHLQNRIQTIVWDFNNRPRLFKPNRLNKSTVCINNTEINKNLFTKKILETYKKDKDKEDITNILLINSFNEWGENMAFEPSEEHGYYNINTLHNYLFLDNP